MSSSDRSEALERINHSLTYLVRALVLELVSSGRGVLRLSYAWNSYNIPTKDGLSLVGFEVRSEDGAIDLVLRYDTDFIRRHLPNSCEQRGIRATMSASISDISNGMPLTEESIEGEEAYAYVSSLDKDDDVTVASLLIEQEVISLRLDALDGDSSNGM